MADPIAQSPFLPPTQQPAAASNQTLGNLVQPNPAAQGTPPATQADFDTRAKGWDTFFSQPAVSAALLQFGINMLQPRQAGQSVAGAAGQSLGAAGETAGRVVSKQLETDLAVAKEGREAQRVGLEGRRTAVDERRAQTDADRAAEEAKYHDRWLEIQNRQVQISAMSAGIAGANNALARDRLTQETDLANKRLKLDQDKLAQDWLSKHIDRADKTDAALLSSLYKGASAAAMPGSPPDIGQINQDFLTMRETLKSVRSGNADIFQLGTEQMWRQVLSNPQLKQQTIEAYGADVVGTAEKKIQEIDKGKGAP